MTISTRVLRKIIYIDEGKCNGCGDCVPSCSQQALRVIDGTARLVSDKYCDGGGACLFHCPTGTLSIEERWAEKFSEEAVRQHLTQGQDVPCETPKPTL